MKKRLFLLATGLVALAVTAPVFAAGKPVKIYSDQYAGDEAINHVVKQLVEANYNTPIDLKEVSVGVAFLGVAHGKRAMFLAAWLPKTHAAYMKRVKDQVVDIGTIYTGARLGWVVPSYVPKDQIDSINDLRKPAVAKRLHHKIQGISAGAGLMRLSKKALKTYGLDYHVTTASGAAMTAALARAIKEHKWIVVTGWSPHWMWGRFDLRYIKDPKKALGSEEHVEAIADTSFKTEAPKVYGLISRMHYTLDQVNTMLADANKTSYKQAAHDFIHGHPDLVKYWVTGNKS